MPLTEIGFSQYAFGLIIILIIWLLGNKIQTGWKKNSFLPPGPNGLPIIGYLPFIDSVKPYETFYELSKKYGSLYSVQMGNILAIVATDGRLIKAAFTQDVFTGRADLYLTHGIMRGYGIICAEGDRWKNQRRFLLTCLKNFGMVKFGPKREKLQTQIMVGVEEFLQTIEMNVNGDLDILNCLLHCVGNIMNSLVFGRTWEEDDPMWRKLRHLAEEGVKHIGVAGPVNFLPFLRFVPKYRRVIDFVITGQKETHAYYQELIDAHDDTKEDDLIGAFKKQMTLESEKGNANIFCKEQFYHFLADAFGAGLDTTVATVNWFLLFMTVYPNIQEKLQKDIDNLVVDDARVYLNSSNCLPYLEAAVAETQRMRPVTPLGIPHSPLQDTTLEGYLIPKRCMFIPLIWAIHMDPENWPNPTLFNPDRFIDSNGKFFTPDNFMPFQTVTYATFCLTIGKRMCIGGEFSKMMTFLFCSNILKNYTVAKCDQQRGLGDSEILEGVCGITFTPKHHTFKFVPRNKPPGTSDNKN